MSTEYTTVSDNDVTLAIPGEIGSVRARLLEAIQKVGYKVLGEQPIYAKRGKQGAACYDCSINVLDYPTTLTISLKQTNDAAVLATFSYEIKSYMRMTKGDRQTLAREAEAIIALTTERLAISACRSCGTQVTDESHFCRRCGAALGLDVPELEVLRLTKDTRGSYHHHERSKTFWTDILGRDSTRYLRPLDVVQRYVEIAPHPEFRRNEDYNCISAGL
jgi:hypothetical protein